MKKILGIAAMLLGLQAAGCPSSPGTQPSPVDVGSLRRMAEEGKLGKAFEAYAAACTSPDLVERTDATAMQTRAEMLLDLFRFDAHGFAAKADPKVRERLLSEVAALKDPTGVDLLSGAVEGFVGALTTSMEAGQHYVCAMELAGILRLKLDKPGIRRAGRNLKGFDELVYRRLVRESIADFEIFALVRRPGEQAPSGERAASALEDLAAEYRALAGLPGVPQVAAAYWNGLAADAVKNARAVRRSPEQAKLATRALVDKLDEQRMNANQWHDKAVRRITNKDPVNLVIEALEGALRHAMFVSEGLGDTPARMEMMNLFNDDLGLLKNAANQP